MTGIEAFLEVLSAAGVTHIFGNPGTTELPLNDALVRDNRFRYIFGLHEIPVVAMADGYAMASGQIGVASVHSACGLGNAMGMLYNAFIEGMPLLLTAGQQDRRLRISEPVIEGDLVSVARPWTKWATEVQRVQDVPTAVRRAVQIARTPPTGPVFLSLPVDLQMETVDALDLSAPMIPNRRARPPVDTLRKAADLLLGARNPAVLAGSRVMEAQAVGELAALAEQLGMPVFAENATSHGRLPMPADHPQYAGVLSYWSPEMRARLDEFDVLLIVGMNLMRLYLHAEPSKPFPDQARLIHLDCNSLEIGKNYPVTVGVPGDIKCGLAELAEIIAKGITPSRKSRAAQRCRSLAQQRDEEQQALRDEIARQRDQRPLTPLTMMDALARALPASVAVVEEAVTTHQTMLERLGALKDPSGHFAHRGWALGWGIGCALGVKLAWPDRPVLALIGDGAAMYGIQGLWSAAHHRIPLVFVICNNRQYKILKDCGQAMSLPGIGEPRSPGMNLADPQIDFVALARALGIEAQRISQPDELTERVQGALRGDRPILIDVAIAG